MCSKFSPLWRFSSRWLLKYCSTLWYAADILKNREKKKLDVHHSGDGNATTFIKVQLNSVHMLSWIIRRFSVTRRVGMVLWPGRVVLESFSPHLWCWNPPNYPVTVIVVDILVSSDRQDSEIIYLPGHVRPPASPCLSASSAFEKQLGHPLGESGAVIVTTSGCEVNDTF